MTEQESKLFTKIGEQHLELESLKERFGNLVKVMASIVQGEIDLSRVMVNLTDQSVVWSPVGERPSTPGTINGIPVCVVAPELSCPPCSL